MGFIIYILWDFIWDLYELMGFVWDLSKTNGDFKLVARGLKPIKYHILVRWTSIYKL